MSGTAGDAHIWTITTGLVPVAACGYSPPTENIVDADDNVIGEQVVHAAATGDECGDCVTAAGADA